jgi:hypothetical protein
MLDLLRNHGKKIFTGLALAVAIGSVGLTAYAQTTTSCCHPGAACCHPGSPCCHGQGQATAAR